MNERPAWFSFWFSGCWRALAKGTARAGFSFVILFLLRRVHRAAVGYTSIPRNHVNRYIKHRLCFRAFCLWGFCFLTRFLTAQAASGPSVHDRHMKSPFEFAVTPGLRASARLIHAPGTFRETPPDSGSLTRALDCDLTHPCASSPLRRRLLGAMAELQAHDPAAAWRCARNGGEWSCGESHSRISPTTRTNSCSDRPWLLFLLVALRWHPRSGAPPYAEGCCKRGPRTPLQ